MSEVKPMRFAHLLSPVLFMTLGTRSAQCTAAFCLPLWDGDGDGTEGVKLVVALCVRCVYPSRQLLAHSHSCRGKPEEQKGEKLIIG